MPESDHAHGHHNVEGASPDSRKDIPNPGAKGVSFYTPAQVPVAGTALDLANAPKLFHPLKIRGIEIQNRIVLSPMCQYSAEDGHFTPWHAAHLGGIITRGPGFSFIEATSVTPEGRITPEDSGLWKDSQIEPLKKVVEFAHSQGQKIGIQLGHAGRKGSTVAPWISGGDTATAAVNGWPDDCVAPSAIPYNDRFPHPKALTLEQIEEIKKAFGAAVKRALTAGFDAIEVHGAHGYLFHEFLSPVTNHRTDKYGGSFENRTRLVTEIVELTRSIIPKDMPLFLRISATDWLEEPRPDLESWTVKDSVRLTESLIGKIDVIDVSSGGLHPEQHIHAGPINDTPAGAAYQSPFAKEIKKAVGDKVLVGTVGGIKNGHAAKQLIDEGLDLVFVASMFQKNPGLVFAFADDVGADVRMPNQIAWSFKGRGSKKETKDATSE